MYGRESWTIKKAERLRIDAFELWCWRRLLRVPWTARRSNQSILKEISPEYSLEGLMLKLQYFGHLMWRTDSFEKTLTLGKIKGRRGRDEGEMLEWHPWLNGQEFEQAMGVGDGQGSLACCSPWGRKEWDRTEWLNWTVPVQVILSSSLTCWFLLLLTLRDLKLHTNEKVQTFRNGFVKSVTAIYSYSNDISTYFSILMLHTFYSFQNPQPFFLVLTPIPTPLRSESLVISVLKKHHSFQSI